jgi:hypothetical protein
MDAGLQTALHIVQYIVHKAQQTRQISDYLKQLVQHVQALQALLQEMLRHGGDAALPVAAAPVLGLLLNGLTEARKYLDKVTPMSGVERFVRSG